MKRLGGMTALVTGSSRGIGLSIAKAFLQEGATVCLAGTNKERLRVATKNYLGEFPRASIELAAFDVLDRVACFEAVAQLVDHWGRFDILVNNAGIYKASSFLNYSIADFELLLNVNVFSAVHLMQACLPTMKKQGFGRVINMASSAGKWGSLNQSAYNTSKHAVVGLTRCVALEMVQYGITVNALCPGLIQSDLSDALFEEHAKIADMEPDVVRRKIMDRIPLGRIIEADELASLAVYIASREASGMTGQSILYDGGMLLI